MGRRDVLQARRGVSHDREQSVKKERGDGGARADSEKRHRHEQSEQARATGWFGFTPTMARMIWPSGRRGWRRCRAASRRGRRAEAKCRRARDGAASSAVSLCASDSATAARSASREIKIGRARVILCSLGLGVEPDHSRFVDRAGDLLQARRRAFAAATGGKERRLCIAEKMQVVLAARRDRFRAIFASVE